MQAIPPLPCVHEPRRTSPLPAASRASRASWPRRSLGRGFRGAKDGGVDGEGVNEGQGRGGARASTRLTRRRSFFSVGACRWRLQGEPFAGAN